MAFEEKSTCFLGNGPWILVKFCATKDIFKMPIPIWDDFQDLDDPTFSADFWLLVALALNIKFWLYLHVISLCLSSLSLSQQEDWRKEKNITDLLIKSTLDAPSCNAL